MKLRATAGSRMFEPFASMAHAKERSRRKTERSNRWRSEVSIGDAGAPPSVVVSG